MRILPEIILGWLLLLAWFTRVEGICISSDTSLDEELGDRSEELGVRSEELGVVETSYFASVIELGVETRCSSRLLLS